MESDTRNILHEIAMSRSQYYRAILAESEAPLRLSLPETVAQFREMKESEKEHDTQDRNLESTYLEVVKAILERIRRSSVYWQAQGV